MNQQAASEELNLSRRTLPKQRLSMTNSLLPKRFVSVISLSLIFFSVTGRILVYRPLNAPFSSTKDDFRFSASLMLSIEVLGTLPVA